MLPEDYLENKARKLKELLDGNDSYKCLYWDWGYDEDTGEYGKILPLKKWEDVEETLNLLEKNYSKIKKGYLKIEIKDESTSCGSNDEIASLQIQIKYGYMRPYLKYRAEGATYAEEEKEYIGETDFDENNNRIGALEFDHDEFIPTSYLTKDINLVKTIFKEFYETGDVSEKYMD